MSPEGEVLQKLGVHGEPGEDEQSFDRLADLAFAPDGSISVTDDEECEDYENSGCS